MSQNSKIEWTDHTFNPWWGCTKVSAACKNCYAETFSRRVGQNVWGDDAGRRFFGDKHWNEPLKWSAAAKAEGRIALAFCASMADIGEIHPSPEIAAKQEDARRQLAALMARTENLRWLLLSKRWGNWPKIGAQLGWCLGPDGWYEPTGRIWAGATVENQEQADKRIPELRRVPAKVRLLSMEPLLGPVVLDLEGIDWVIAGGESGPSARPSHPDWFRSIRDQCKAANVPFFFKQWGEWAPATESFGITGSRMPENDPKYTWIGWDGARKAPSCHGLQDPVMAIAKVGKKAAGRLLDGVEHSEFPEARS